MSKATRHRRPLIEALEPRLLFSATADIAVFDDGHADGQSLTQAAEQLDLVSIYMPDTPSMMESQGLEPDFDIDSQADIAPSVQSTVTTLVFVDTGVANYQTLVDDIRSHTDANSTAIIYIDATKDGIAQISDYLAGASGISAIHVISHGVAGNLQLGNQVVNENNISQYAQQLAAWKTALGEDADILLYGCDLAANQSGINLLRQLSDLTGADIAASSDLSGNGRAGADWDLEEKVGVIEAKTLFDGNQSMQWQGVLADVTHLYSGVATNEQIISAGGTVMQGVQLTSTQTVDRIQVMLANHGTSSTSVQMIVHEATYNGPAIATASVTTASLGGSLGWVNFDFTHTTFNAYTVYWVEFKTNDGADNLVGIGYINSNVIASEFVVNNSGDSTKDMAIALIDVGNTPPQGFNWAIDTQEDTPLALTAANFGFSDVDGHSFTGVVISSLPAAGSLSLTGSGSVTQNQFISIADINAGKLVFTPAPNENATNYAQIGFQVRDSGGGDNTDPTPNTLTIDVSYVNDAPVNTVPAGPVVTPEDTAVAITGVSISDIDDYDLWDIEVVLTVNHGVLNVSGGSAVIVGSGTGSVTLTGTLSQVNATLAATVNYTPGANYVGADTFTITTNDKGAGRTGDNDATDTDTVAINVTAINDAPTVANPIPNQSTNEEALYSYTFPINTFNDVDGDTLSYTATLANGNPLPAWLFFNAGTRTFSGVPDDGDIGTISIKVTANDGQGGTAEDTFDLTINNVNDLPFVNIPIPNQNATEDSAFSYSFPANTFGDGDVGNSFTYTAELAGGGALPGWLNFDSATRTFSGTPANADVGTLSIKVIATDSAGATVSDNFDIAIANTNDAPTVANQIPNQTATENQFYNYTFPINTFNDQDVGDTLTYTAQIPGGAPLPGWLTFDGNTRTFSGTPSNGDVGNITIEVIANDGTTTVSDFFDLQVNNVGSSNQVYETSGPSTDTQIITAGVPFFQSFFHDSVGATYTVDSIVLQLVKDPSAAAQTITVTLLSGAYNGTVVGSATVSSADIGTTLAWKALNFTGTVLTDNQLYFIRIESSSNDGQVKAAIHNADVYANGSFHSSTGVADTGRDVAFQVSSGANNNPTLANPIPNQTATEDAAFNFQFASNTFNDIDVGDTLTYTATMADGSALPGWLNFNAATRTFSGTPINADVGTISIKVTADDGQGGTPATDTFDLVIANTNDAPTVANPIPNQTATEDSAFNFTFANNVFNDVDVGNTLTYTAQLAGGGALPAWLSFDAATRTFSGTPLNAHVGTVSIDVIANDGNGGTVTDTFDITVINTNDAPTVANPIPDQNANEDAAFNFQFAANTFADQDVGDTLSYSVQLTGGGALPSWLSFNAGTRTFSGTPLNAHVGTISIDVIASDGNGGTVTDTFNLTVINTNDAPTVTVTPTDYYVNEQTWMNLHGTGITVADDDGDSLTVTLAAQWSNSNLAATVGTTGVVIVSGVNTKTLVLSGTAAQLNDLFAGNNGGTLTYRLSGNTPVATDVVTMTASDGSLSGNDSFTVNITAVNDAPVNTVPGAQVTSEDTDLIFSAGNGNQIQITDVDAGGSSVQVSISVAHGILSLSSVAGLTFSTGIGLADRSMVFTGTVANINNALSTLYYTPDNGYSGAETLSITTNDLGNTGTGGALSDTDTVNITVNPINDAPTVANAIPNQNATEDAAFSFQFAANTFADSDVGDTLTYSAQLAGGGALPAWLSFDAATRTFSGTPTNAFVGTVSIDVIANDGNGGTVTDTFDIVVANTNDAPTVANAIPNQNATEDAAFSFQFAANTFADPDVGDTLTYSAQLAGGGALPA
ncbi:putative Ig domain-containing protein, partial [Cellvibrio sp. OA-2007]|uniref:putative Ig domain-containing protein n=1 Tax=Cellvibrio sp. OA-2007 TaxID=529823 RepID=UPI000A55C0C6